MTDQRQPFNSRKDVYRERQTTRDDFISFAKSNANYCYQMSLWWWSVYNQHRMTNFTSTNQTCECEERNASVEEGYDCCQNGDNFGNAVGPYGCDLYTCEDCPRDLCKDCPDTYANTHCYQPSGKNFRTDAHDGFSFQQKYSDALYYNICDDNINEDNNYDSASNDVLNICDNDVDDDEDDDEDDDVEIDDEFLKFLEQSERHRQEREKSEYFFKFCFDKHFEMLSLIKQSKKHNRLEQNSDSIQLKRIAF